MKQREGQAGQTRGLVAEITLAASLPRRLTKGIFAFEGRGRRRWIARNHKTYRRAKRRLKHSRRDAVTLRAVTISWRVLTLYPVNTTLTARTDLMFRAVSLLLHASISHSRILGTSRREILRHNSLRWRMHH